ncbi:MAG TPA: hypothetical protein VFC09_11370 [Candidatus Dormibacteraeota bacterium]|nr:hypothetical protein [Candidatus Dormibacteraeota bacterium]
MRRALRRLVVALLCSVAAAALAPVRIVHACDQAACLPVLAGVSPLQVTLDGKALHITLLGQNLSAVNGVIVAPLVAPQGWVAYNDQTLLVTLPPTIAPGIYSVRVVSPEGASDPSMAPQFEVFPAPPPPTPFVRPAPTPKPTPAPTPPLPDSGVVALAPTPSAQPSASAAPLLAAGAPAVAPTSAPIDIMVGLMAGALVYILWGNPRRLDGTWRSEPWRHLVGRPVQAMHVGNICLYCGRLHFIVTTRRDLWRAGKYCRPKCFISAEATPSPLGDEGLPATRVAPRRAAHTDGC